jgi:hypothetical protein
MRTRGFVRANPRSPVTVALEQGGEPFAYGAVANISEGGASVWTSIEFCAGRELTVRLSGARLSQPLEVPAVVVWGGEDQTRGTARIHRYGLRWVEPTSACRSGIRRLLSLSY